MSDDRDPSALLRHAIQIGDWRLVELLARVLSGDLVGRPAAAPRAYFTLVARLGLSDRGDYHRG